MIDFILHKENCTKHEAILKAKAMVEGEAVEMPQNGAGKLGREKEAERTALLEQVFTYFKNGVHNSGPAREYLAKRCLDYTRTEVGYNSGQFHHGKRKDEGLIRACVEHGILLGLGTKSRTGNPAYKPFGKWCVAFPLRNEGYRITGLYFRSGGRPAAVDRLAGILPGSATPQEQRTPADLQAACDILFESIILKVGELDGSFRQFFEKLKGFGPCKQSV